MFVCICMDSIYGSIARLQQGIQGQLQQYPNAIRPARSGVAALAVPVYACEASLQGQG